MMTAQTVHLAHNMMGQGDSALRAVPNSPTVVLAHDSGKTNQGALALREGDTCREGLIQDSQKPALLISFVYSKKFLLERARYRYRHWVMDSGAFTAWKSGAPISLDAYTDICREQLSADPTLREVFALDVIGDWQASLRNAEAMWNAGVPAIPCYHYGEPEHVLLSLARDYPKIALGGMVGLKPSVKLRFAQQCFARVWPKPIHGFGVGTEAMLMAVPWHSVDATNWEIGPCKYGRWAAYKQHVPVRGSGHDLRVEIAHYLKMERLARHRWANEMAVIEAQLAAAGWRQ